MSDPFVINTVPGPRALLLFGFTSRSLAKPFYGCISTDSDAGKCLEELRKNLFSERHAPKFLEALWDRTAETFLNPCRQSAPFFSGYYALLPSASNSGYRNSGTCFLDGHSLAASNAVEVI